MPFAANLSGTLFRFGTTAAGHHEGVGKEYLPILHAVSFRKLPCLLTCRVWFSELCRGGEERETAGYFSSKPMQKNPSGSEGDARSFPAPLSVYQSPLSPLSLFR